MTMNEIKKMERGKLSFINFISEDKLYPNFVIRGIKIDNGDNYSGVEVNSYNTKRMLSKTRKYRFLGNHHKEQSNIFLTLLKSNYNLNDVTIESEVV